MSPEKETINANNTPHIHRLRPYRVLRPGRRQPGTTSLSSTPSSRERPPDEYSNPPQWAITSNIRFGKPGDIVNSVKAEVRCRSYLVEQVDERTGVVSKIRRFTTIFG